MTSQNLAARKRILQNQARRELASPRADELPCKATLFLEKDDFKEP